MRLIAISCDSNFEFSVDNHTMTIIETDGVNNQPLVVDSLQIFASQRYSFVVRTCFNFRTFWSLSSFCAVECESSCKQLLWVQSDCFDVFH